MTKTTRLTRDQIEIRKSAEQNNEKFRKHHWRTYRRIKREKKWYWRLFYKIFSKK